MCHVIFLSMHPADLCHKLHLLLLAYITAMLIVAVHSILKSSRTSAISSSGFVSYWHAEIGPRPSGTRLVGT